MGENQYIFDEKVKVINVGRSQLIRNESVYKI